ncbi:aminotransferase [Microbacterium oxydans]|uniref:5-aminovalerate aminotransferase DavT n=1 Tax=Microbacterium oxydans TaxID=82380 RepID=A0A0F0L7A2_9MICO|nr:aminotransferase [Microbacterium oxydans]KJL28574.1 5-aminovalerate aminotransferase DavT [Microbacterium oxydans]
MTDGTGLVRPDVSTTDAARIARDCYGITVTAEELGSNQDRNFLLTADDGTKSVLRIDNPVFGDDARDAQHAALDAYRAAGVSVPAVLPGLDGALTQRWNGLAARRSEFAPGEPLVDAGYLAPVVLAEFGALAAASVNALAALDHPGLDRAQMWDMRVAHEQVEALAPSIADSVLRGRVLRAAAKADAALTSGAGELPVQAIHGDLTDDNVMGERGADTRLHPRTVLDLGDLALGWRVAELAVCVSSMLHHEPDRPLRVMETVAAFHRDAPLSETEARAVWPLVVLRAALLVASGWRQLEIDGANDYARERIAGEQAIFDAATLLPQVEMIEHVLATVGMDDGGFDATGLVGDPDAAPLAALLPELTGRVAVIDPTVESAALDAGRWLDEAAEQGLIDDAIGLGVAVAVLPYGTFRLTRARVDSAQPGETWSTACELHLPAGTRARVAAPATGRVTQRGGVARMVIDLGAPEDDPEWVLEITGLDAEERRERPVSTGETLGWLAASFEPRRMTVGIHRADAPERRTDGAALVAPERVPAWRRLTADPAPLLGLPSFVQDDEAEAELHRREQIFAAAQERYYEHPPQIERGWRHHLIDTTARTYVDMVNNVAGLGHAHPKVADAAERQLRTLATNSRFLFRDLAEYSERLLALMPEGSDLDTVLLVNSGSEAVDLAIRLAQAATGRRTVVALREAYHGWTMASDAVTTSAYDNPSALATRPDWVHVADVPNRFRGTYRGDDVAGDYLADLATDLAQLDDDRQVAAFLCESILGNAGGVVLPDGYLAGAYEQVRAAGGLCIADEVQVGFGRMGSAFWGFELAGVVPDIVTIAKPMGNGYPIGGVITSRRIADALSAQGQFFSSAGGSTLSCRVGIAVLDAMIEDDLQRNAAVVGAHLADGLRELADRHPLVGVVHGEGLYLGVELVRDRDTMEPAAAEAAAICERLRELGVIVLTTSERSNVLKIKPPLCLTTQSADHVVAMLDRVLTDGW